MSLKNFGSQLIRSFATGPMPVIPEGYGVKTILCFMTMVIMTVSLCTIFFMSFDLNDTFGLDVAIFVPTVKTFNYWVIFGLLTIATLIALFFWVKLKNELYDAAIREVEASNEKAKTTFKVEVDDDSLAFKKLD